MAVEQKTFSTTLPQLLWSAEQVRVNECHAAAATGVSMSMLMERAGGAAFDLIQERWPQTSSILILAGSGNNGGDAYVVARLAKKSGLNVQLVHVGDDNSLVGDAVSAKQNWLALGCSIDTPKLANFNVDLIVDGLLGSGMKGPVREYVAELIERANLALCPILALDIPSGLQADTGAVTGVAIEANATISYVGMKQGLFTGKAAQYCGELFFAGLGIEKAFIRQVISTLSRITYNEMTMFLAPRNKASHKGDFGYVICIGGNIGMPGAIRLAAEACLRGGAGLVKVLIHESNDMIVCSSRPELMVVGLENLSDDSHRLQPYFDKASTIVLGPGLGTDAWAKALYKLAIKCMLPKVLDADALNLLAQSPNCDDNRIITPHPGEAARLLNCSTQIIEADRYTAVQKLQKKYGGVVVLKGSGTLICNADKLYVANVGNPGMASGGMGDLLSGLIGSLIAQGLSLIDAAALGVCIHGNAADIAALDGERGMLASDLLPHIRKLVNP